MSQLTKEKHQTFMQNEKKNYDRDMRQLNKQLTEYILQISKGKGAMFQRSLQLLCSKHFVALKQKNSWTALTLTY